MQRRESISWSENAQVKWYFLFSTILCSFSTIRSKSVLSIMAVILISIDGFIRSNEIAEIQLKASNTPS